MKKIFTLIAMVALAGNLFAAWTGSGHGEEHNGVWYVVYNTTEYSIGAYSNNSGVDFVLSGPGAVLSYDIWKRSTATQTTYIYGYNAANQQSTIASYSSNTLGTSAANKSNNISLDITKIKAQAGGTLVKFIQNVFVTMAQYLEAPSVTSLDFGNKLVGAEDDVKTFTIAWCNVPAMTWEVQGVANGVVEVSVDANSQEGYYNTSTFTVTYHRASVSDLTNAKIVISDSFNGYSKTINLAGATENVLTPEFTWNIESTLHVGDVVENVVASNSPAATTYEIVSFVPAADEVANANTFVGNTFTANRAGVATIKVSQPATTGFYAGEETKVVTIEKRTPVFSLNATEPFYFESDIENVLNLTEGDAELISYSTSDASIAEVIDGTLHIYDVAGTVTITVAHATNYMWAELSHDYEITPQNAPLFIINSEAKLNELKSTVKGTCVYDNGIKLSNASIFDGWDDKYVDIHFDAIPDKLSFTTTAQAGATGVEFRVAESANGSSWDEIWSSNETNNTVTNLQLQPSTRYIRLIWSGNLSGVFHNVAVTEQQIAPIEVAAGALNVANSTYYSMFCHAETVVLLDAMAYTASFEDDALVLTECEDGIIPANTVVMVAGAEDHYSYLPYDGTVAPVDNNAFKIHHYSDAENHRDYVLAEKDGVVAFHRYIADDETAEIDGKKVLVWESASAQTPAVINIVTEGETATALLPVYDDNKQYQNNQIYTIMGLPVSDMSAPGIYILNGQKYIVR